MSDMGAVFELARANLSPATPPQSAPWSHLCSGMAEYRAGNYRNAEDLLKKALGFGLVFEPKATALLFLAMSEYSAQQEPEARRSLDEAHALLEQKISSPTDDVIDPKSTLQDWLICQIARREADQLILGKSVERRARRHREADP